MKKIISGIFTCVCHALLNLSSITRLLRRPAVSDAIVRLVAIILIAILLTPVFLFNSTGRVQAQNGFILPAKAAAPISAPPQPFVTGVTQSPIAASIGSSISSIKEYFSEPALPDGFEIAKVPTVSEKIVSSLGSSVDSVFGLSGSSAGKTVNSTLKKTASKSISTTPMYGQLSAAVDFDFDGDSKADIARWHASNTEWKIKNSSNGNYQTITIGSSSAVIAPGDFDGDGIMDAATFNAGTWTIRKSSNSQTITVAFGSAGDKPVVGDYDGDGKSDPAIFRPSTNTWWLLYSSTATSGSMTFGSPGDILVQGKFDNDALTDIAVYRPSTGVWHIQGSTSGYYSAAWGNSYDIPVPADYTGDGRTDLAVYRGAIGTWYVLKSEDYSTYLTQGWGNYGDQPVPADYDGDGKADYSVWRPTTGMWYIIKSSNSSYDLQTLGVAGDTAISSAYIKQIGGLVYSYDFARVRLSPKNSVGGTDLYSRNFSWSSGLVGLPGRAGLDAGFGISYNSLIWTKDAATNTVVFDVDNSNLTPGFRMGFPTIEPVYYDAQTGKFAYMMIAPSGARVEFRQTSATNVYETADSSYAQLKINGSGTPNDAADTLTLTVTGTNGTNMLYDWKNGAYRLQKITDRNGNYIEVNHNTDGQLQTVTDTLGRVITVNYTDGLPSSITQDWKTNNGEGTGTVTRTYATFTYTTQAITTNFSGSPTVIGPGGGYTVKVLQKITYPTASNGTGPSTVFTYNTWGQVTKVTNYAADNSSLNYVRTNLPADATNSQADCPRFTETYTQAANFNGGNEVTIKNTFTENVSYTLPDSTNLTGTRIEIKTPDGSGNADKLVTKIYSASSGWAESLPVMTEDWADEGSGLVKKRWTTDVWTQDDTNLTYIQNPRVTESKVGDDANTKRTKIYYLMQTGSSTVSQFGLVSKVEVYDKYQTNVLKTQTNGYSLDSNYVSRRIIGLPLESYLYEGTDSSGTLMSKVTYAYDENGYAGTGQSVSATKHDNGNFGTGFSYRGNVTSSTRWDATNPSNTSLTSKSQIKYNITGSPISKTDPLNRVTAFSYTDTWNDNTTRDATFAYPTTISEVTSSGNNSSNIMYRYDTGMNVWAKSPAPAGNAGGKETTRTYDEVGRLERQTLVNSGSYTRYEYPANGIQSKVYTTVIDTDNDGADADDEVMSETWTDGAGRVLRSRAPHPGSTGGWAGSIVEYNILGQVTRTTLPTEISVSNANNPNSWTPAGDDNRGVDSNNQPIWLWNSQQYDWKGRVTRTIPSDSNGSDGKDQLMSYDGCGCAGGGVTTILSEEVPVPGQTYSARRKQKIYADILGRQEKTEIYEWNGTSVYTTTVQTFNGRNQITKTRQYAGTTTSSTYQDIDVTYDGHGRMKTRHYPIDDPLTDTSWSYNADDSISQIVDPRDAITSFTYNSRGLLSQLSYTPPSGSTTVTNAPDVTFTYDALGNRTSMETEDVSLVNYSYDELSRLTNETTTFDGLSTSTFSIGYTYHLGGGLKSVTDPFSSTVNYTNDKMGRLTAVTGSVWAQNTTGEYASNIKYRAGGQIKQMDYDTPDDTPQIKLEYDNRFRVSHSEVTSNNITSGYLLKADFSYLNDSRVSAKDDLLENKFDRTMQYDFAGRLTFNQFGIGVGSDSSNKRVYEQTIVYDAFSQMTSRSGVHWDNAIGFTASYTNGRMVAATGQILTYDESGNIIYQQGDSNNPHVYQQTTYDASGRRTGFFDSTKGRIGGQMNMIREHKTEQLYDGDGRPVVEKQGSRRYNVTNTNPAAMTVNIKGYQVWSTVLGASLTSVSPTGAKVETSVYAGKALIAKQKRFVDGSTNFDSIEWRTADPVTGTLGTFNYDSGGSVRTTEEIEPLGQKIDLTDPTPLEDPVELPNQIVFGSAGDMEWQCQAGDKFYKNKFVNMPFHCQKKALFEAGIDLPWKDEREEDPHGVSSGGSQGGSASDGTASSADSTLPPVDLTPTNKPDTEQSGTTPVPPSHIPGENDELMMIVSQIMNRGSAAFNDSIPDFRDASFNSSVDDFFRKLSPDVQLEIGVDYCARTMFGVRLLAGTTWAVKGKGAGVMNFETLEGTTVLNYLGRRRSLVGGLPAATFSAFVDRLPAGDKGMAGDNLGRYAPGSGYATGIYLGKNPDNGETRATNRAYILEDMTQGGDIMQSAYNLGYSLYQGTQIHETGNILAKLTGKYQSATTETIGGKTYQFGTTGTPEGDPDSGQAFEQCVWGYVRKNRTN